MSKLRVDIVMPVYNSERFLEKCLESIYREISVNRLIVIDSRSKDRTLDILSKYSNVVIYQFENTLAKIRMLGIRKVKTEFFCFIDSDIELLPGFFNLINLLRNPRVGGVDSYPLNPYGSPLEYYYHRATIKLTKKLGMKPYGRPFGPSIIRTKVVKEISIPECLDSYEDYFLYKYVIDRGYEWKTVSDKLYALHHKPYQARKRKHNVFWYERMCGRPVAKRTLWKLATSLPIGLYAFHLYPNPPMITWGFKGALRRLIALLKNYR